MPTAPAVTQAVLDAAFTLVDGESGDLADNLAALRAACEAYDASPTPPAPADPQAEVTRLRRALESLAEEAAQVAGCSHEDALQDGLRGIAADARKAAKPPA